MEKVQPREARFVHNYYNHDVSVSNIVEKIKWEPIEVVRTNLCVIFHKDVCLITPFNLNIQLP